MINWKSGRAASIALFAPLLLGASSLNSNLVLQPQSKLWISGTSTVQSFECSATFFEMKVNTTGESPVLALLSGQKAVTSARVTVPTSRLDCRNGTMNQHMLKALKADQHPQIQFNLSSYELVPGANGLKARLKGSLEIGGSSKPVVIESDAKDAGNGALKVAGRHTVKMSEFGLKRPSLMMGTMKVGDEVVVHFDLLLKA